MTKSDSADAFELQRKIMTFEAQWPQENPTLNYQIRGAIGYIAVLMLGGTMLMEALHDIKDLAKLADTLFIVVSILLNTVKYTGVYVNRNHFIYAMKLMKTPIFVSYPDDLDHLMVNTINSLQRLSRLYSSIIFVCVTLMSISPFFDSSPLPFPFSYELGNFRPLMYVFQVGTTYLCGLSNACLDTLPASFMSVATAQMEILACKIMRIREEHEAEMEEDVMEMSQERDKVVIEKLRECVFHHEAIIEFVERIDKIFSFSAFMQFLGSAIVICNTSFRFVLVPVGSAQSLMLVVYQVVLLLQLFMYCWYGNDVILKSESIRDACFSFRWYYCGTRVKKYLLILMERSKRPLKVTAFKFSTLSLSAFTAILQWTYSYFTLMMNLYRK